MAENIFFAMKSAEVHEKPYSHVGVEGTVLPPEYASQLLERYPSVEDIIKNSFYGRRPVIQPGRKICCYAADILRDESTIDPVWKEFVAEHFSYNGFQQFIELFGERIFALSPKARDILAGITPDDVGIALRPGEVDRKVIIDGGVCIDMPDVSGGLPRIHLDTPNKIGGALFYVRDPAHTSPGGDFEMYAPQGRVHTDTKYVVQERDVSNMKKLDSFPYTHNSALAFLNSPNSFHAVGQHFDQAHVRYSVVISFNVNTPLFDFSQYWEPFLVRKTKGLMRRLGLTAAS